MHEKGAPGYATPKGRSRCVHLESADADVQPADGQDVFLVLLPLRRDLRGHSGRGEPGSLLRHYMPSPGSWM